MPTLYLAGWASWRTPGHHGPGGKFSIMQRTPRWAWGTAVGVLPQLGPQSGAEVVLLERLLEARHQKRPADPGMIAQYRGLLDARWCASAQHLRPGVLVYQRLGMAAGYPQEVLGTVGDGATLCCACSVGESLAGRCHRAWLAPHLRRAGWAVVLDGEDHP